MEALQVTAWFGGAATFLTALAGFISSIRNGQNTTNAREAIHKENAEIKANVNVLSTRVDGHMKKLLRATAHIASDRGKEIGRKAEVKRTQALPSRAELERQAAAKPKRRPKK